MKTGVLFVSPHREDATALSRMIGALSVPFEHVANIARARKEIQNGLYAVILTEANLPDGTWLDVLNLARHVASGAEVIVTDAGADARFWAEVLNLGAYDVIAQPFAAGEVQRILCNACSRFATEPKVTRAAG
ncbi:MAG TPA: response regulator [Bryobacteraceae bacterium]|nr:response regulator [Bryobacteraceae bacterium]